MNPDSDPGRPARCGRSYRTHVAVAVNLAAAERCEAADERAADGNARDLPPLKISPESEPVPPCTSRPILPAPMSPSLRISPLRWPRAADERAADGDRAERGHSSAEDIDECVLHVAGTFSAPKHAGMSLCKSPAPPCVSSPSRPMLRPR